MVEENFGIAVSVARNADEHGYSIGQLTLHYLLQYVEHLEEQLIAEGLGRYVVDAD